MLKIIFGVALSAVDEYVTFEIELQGHRTATDWLHSS
jgi:hypothetical protein